MFICDGKFCEGLNLSDKNKESYLLTDRSNIY